MTSAWKAIEADPDRPGREAEADAVMRALDNRSPSVRHRQPLPLPAFRCDSVTQVAREVAPFLLPEIGHVVASFGQNRPFPVSLHMFNYGLSVQQGFDGNYTEGTPPWRVHIVPCAMCQFGVHVIELPFFRVHKNDVSIETARERFMVYNSSDDDEQNQADRQGSRIMVKHGSIWMDTFGEQDAEMTVHREFISALGLDFDQLWTEAVERVRIRREEEDRARRAAKRRATSILWNP
jgi:hypothetical protein